MKLRGLMDKFTLALIIGAFIGGIVGAEVGSYLSEPEIKYTEHPCRCMVICDGELKIFDGIENK